jgi:serine/arginine repetitive matrix protein 2
MEEDNDDFLGGVIEFGDGRQYKIEANEDPPLQPSLSSKSQPGVIAPVSKEERFVDDFDRSWPKSRSSPASSSRDFTPAPLSHGSGNSPQVSPVALQSAHSPQDSSRVLFNERSNRLEPYSHSHRPGQGQYPLIDLRNRDFGVPTNVQVLQKSGGEYESRARRYSGSGSGSGPSHPFSNDRPRDRDHPSRRDGPSPQTRDGIPLHPDYMGRGRDFNAERGRRTSMAPPPIPQHVIRRSSQEGGRQLPPHLAQSLPDAPLHQLSSRDSRLPPTEPEPAVSGSSQPHPSYSPAVSTASASLVSPAATAAIALPHLTAPELDEARKDVMQSAAARAKQRRQQEEAEREAQKERARRKAAELEEKMKAEAEKAKQKEPHDTPTTAQVSIEDDVVIAVIEEAVKSVTASKSPTSESEDELLRPPSSKHIHVQPDESSRLIPTRASIATPTSPILSPATQTSSWRVKVNPQPLPPPSSASRQIQPRPPAPSFHPPPRSALEESIADGANEDLEVVDFFDMGKFVGIPEAKEDSSETEPNPSATAVLRTSRAVASDFFEDKLTPTIEPASTKTDFGTWRQKVSQDVLDKASLKSEPQNDSSQKKVLSAQDLSTPPKEPLADIAISVEAIADASVKDCLPPHLVSQRTPRNQGFYKEATMSALDDAMSRIKGAIVDIHSSDVSKDATALESEHLQGRSLQPTPQKSAAPKERWIPPALRLRNNFDFTDEPREVFDVTGGEPPRSPAPARNAYTVQISSMSRAVEFIHRRQLQAFFRPIFQTRWDILSFDPPVEGMNRRDLSLNDVLFRKPPGAYKGKPRYRVMLPRHGTYANRPRVQMPSASLLKPNGVGAFGRPTAADGASSWRNPAPSPKVDSIIEESPSIALDTMSRSPPPELPQSNIASMPKSNESSPSKSEPSTSLRSRSQPKMPAGSAVAFYRDSRIDAVEPDPKPLVNFTVTSELEEFEGSDVVNAQATSPVPFALITRDSKSNPCNSTINGVKRSSPLGRSKDDSLIMSKTDSRSSDDSVSIFSFSRWNQLT